MSIAFHREQSRYESLINIAERYDGYTNSIRKVMEKKDEESGLVGVVADIIKVDKRKKRAKVKLTLHGKSILVDLAFEVMENLSFAAV